MQDRRRIPQATIRRLPLYLRDLTDTVAAGVAVTSSAEMALRTGISSEQIRKDLAYFGAFGTRGVGYDARQLSVEIRRILGIQREVGVALVGAGHLGFALARYSRRNLSDVRVTLVFDSDPAKVGTAVGDLEVLPMSRLEAEIRRGAVRLAVVAVPGEEANRVMRRLARAGVEAVLNFSPAKINLPGMHVHAIDLTMELQSLAYYTSLGRPPAASGAGAAPASMPGDSG